MTTHTPGPWKQSGKRIFAGYSIAKTYGSNALNDARMIEKAVNCHADLLEACKAAMLLYDLPDIDLSATAQAVRDQIKSAIAKAEGEDGV